MKKELVLRFWLLLLLVWSLPSAGQVYEWVDESGRRHFSDRKPPSGMNYQIRGDTSTGNLSTYTSTIRLGERQPQARVRPKSRGSVSSRGSSRAMRKAEHEQRCQSYLHKLKRVQAKLRRGYREPRGNQLRQQRRELSQRYRRECS